MKIALLAMACRPYHAGHHALIELASNECDKVHVYVSTSDRARKGEVTVYGDDMVTIWTDMIEPILPENVSVEYGGSPVGKVWAELGEANELAYMRGDPGNSYVIYADPQDIAANFPEKSITKYAGDLNSLLRVTRRAVSRSETVDISGTEMRQYISDGNRLAFIRNLPKGLDGNAVWNRLYASSKR